MNNGDLQIVKSWEVPEVLVEISGIANVDAQNFACVQDELGSIFLFNTASSEITKKIDFAGPGDYEGIALAGANAYVVRSDGHIFEVENFNSESLIVHEYPTFLTASQNVESLSYDRSHHRLLLITKGADPNSNDYKGIYAFDLNSKKLSSNPVFKIDLNDETLQKMTGKKSGNEFQPSDIEIHPSTREIYILQGVQPGLLVLDTEGRIKKCYQMDKKNFPQAEGLSFSSAGDMFISNEGKKGKGNILQVK